MTVRPVDPDDPFRGPRWLAVPLARLARTPLGRWLGIHVVSAVDPHLLRLSGGRVSLLATYHHVRLTVPGRTTGIPRTVPLLYFTEGDEVVLVASSFGRPDHPAWYRNVLAHPDVVLTDAGGSHPYVAREVEGEAHARLFARAVRLYPGYADYARMVDEAGRHLPILALRPA